MEAIDRIIIRSLRSFLAYINQKDWFGRENEAVSLYAVRFLQRECSGEGPLKEPTQIGIEVGAAETPKEEIKGTLSKRSKMLFTSPADYDKERLCLGKQG